MTWNELYPVVAEQAKYALLRYEEPERKKDKVQELVCPAFDKHPHDLEAGRYIKKQDFKCFVTQRAKEVDIRCVCKDGYGGTCKKDVLGYYLRRWDSKIRVTGLEDWMTIPGRSREAANSALTFNVDYSL